NFNFTVEIPKFVPEYMTLHELGNEKPDVLNENKFCLNENMIIKGKLSPLITILDQEDFILLMKILNYNIIYNDGKDKLFMRTSKIPISQNKNFGKTQNSSSKLLCLI